MSGQQPLNPRRRRIAGERRGARTDEAGPAEPLAPVGVSPVDVSPAEPVAPVDVSPAEPEAPEPGRRRGWWGSRASLVGLGVTLVVLVSLVALGALGLLGNDGFADIRRADAVQRAADTAPAAAERAASAILAYDHRTLDADEDAATRFMTPQFAEKYTATFDKAVKPSAKEFKAKVTADVRGSAVVRAGEDTVRVLLFVDQTTVSTAHDGPQLALNRVEMVMTRRGDSWLVDDITSY